MAKPKSFEEFYYVKTGKNCNVKEVMDYAKNNHGDYTPFEAAMFFQSAKKQK